ncbi:MAG: NYN domain-containing protein [Chitinophagales bacterium]|nr:NYN domain-containing protein [Chitinophagales bacterium]
MTTSTKSSLTKIAVFYDGNYFYHVSNYYNYVHERKSRISIKGLHEFIRRKVSDLEGEGNAHQLCQIVDAHYFRGRLSASEASSKGKQLYYDRVFDDILMSEGVTTHYLPLRSFYGRRTEKGVDVWLALEAFELAFYKKFDVLVLIASDGDYVPLVRKLNSLGTRVMILSWDFEFVDDYGNNRSTRTSQDLLEESAYPIAMHELIDNRVTRDSFPVNNLFVPKQERDVERDGQRIIGEYEGGEEDEVNYNRLDVPSGDKNISTVLSLKEGYGFISYPPNNLFFHYSEINNVDFNELRIGDTVSFELGTNEETGQDIAIEISLIE